MNDYRFSVLISVYKNDSKLWLIEALSSIWDNQILKPDEIVIGIDGDITDEVNFVINSFANNKPVKIFRFPTNRGLGYVLRDCLQNCSFNYIARMDADDISYPDRFLKQINIFKQCEEIDVVGAWINEFIDSPNIIISSRKLPEHNIQIKDYAKSRCPMNHPVVMFKKDAVLLAGNYIPIHLFEDYYLWGRMIMNGAQFYNIQESLLSFRTNQDMFKRRGGIKYAISEIKLQFIFYRIGFLDLYKCILNIFLRFFVRIIPSILRSKLYKYLLRS